MSRVLHRLFFASFFCLFLRSSCQQQRVRRSGVDVEELEDILSTSSSMMEIGRDAEGRRQRRTLTSTPEDPMYDVEGPRPQQSPADEPEENLQKATWQGTVDINRLCYSAVAKEVELERRYWDHKMEMGQMKALTEPHVEVADQSD